MVPIQLWNVAAVVLGWISHTIQRALHISHAFFQLCYGPQRQETAPGTAKQYDLQDSQLKVAHKSSRGYPWLLLVESSLLKLAPLGLNLCQSGCQNGFGVRTLEAIQFHPGELVLRDCREGPL